MGVLGDRLAVQGRRDAAMLRGREMDQVMSALAAGNEDCNCERTV